MRGLNGKVAAVTGAGSGIGQAAAQRLGEEGCKVAVLDRNAEGARQTVDNIRKGGGDAIAITVDVATKRASKQRSRRSSRSTASSTSSCSNAGIFSGERDGKVGALPKSVWDEIVGVI